MSTLINLVKSLRENLREDEDGNLEERVQRTLAVAIAMTLSVPAEATFVSGINAYNTNHLHTVRGLVSEINELFLLNTDEVLKIVAEFYTARYNLVHNPALSIKAVNAVVESLFEETRGLDGAAAPEISLNELTRLQLTVAGLMCSSDEVE